MAEISVLGVVNFLWPRRRLIFGGTGIIMVAAIVRSLIGSDQFTVESRFKPEASDAAPSQLLGLAQQFGFNLAATDNAESPEFYEGVIESRTLMRQVAQTHFSFVTDEGDTLSGTLDELYEIEAPDRDVATVLLLDGLVNASVDLRRGEVNLRTSARWPPLAVQMNERILELVNSFNLETRQSQAAAERAFVQQRVAETRHELREAEAELQDFLKHNRLYQDSPELSFQANRLRRVVDLRQQVLTSLSEAYEQARIDEVRDTPVITIVDHPADAIIYPDKNLVLAGVLGLIIGGMFCLVMAITLEYLGQQRSQGSEEYAELQQHRQALLRIFRSRRTAG